MSLKHTARPHCPQQYAHPLTARKAETVGLTRPNIFLHNPQRFPGKVSTVLQARLDTMEIKTFADLWPELAEWKPSRRTLLRYLVNGARWEERGQTQGTHLHATVRHGHGIVCCGVAGDLAVIGTGGGSKDVSGVDKVRAGGVSSAKGPVEHGGCFPHLIVHTHRQKINGSLVCLLLTFSADFCN